MPSRQLHQSPPSTSDFINRNHRHNHHHHHHLLIPLLAATASVCTTLLLLFFLCLRARKRTTLSPPSSAAAAAAGDDSKPPHRLSYSLLRRATNSFSTRLGHGGFGTVFAGTLAGKPVAVKLMDSSSYQGEREFHNELFFATKLRSRHVVAAVGFSCDPKRRRFVLVYDLMHKGNLQDALLHRKCPELADWNTRFKVGLDIARGVQYLHSLDPPVIHGDIKPSNILLDTDFSAKIADFGLARLKSEPHFEVLGGNCDDLENKKEQEQLACEEGVVGPGFDDLGSLVEETESVKSDNTGFFEEGTLGLEQSPEDFVRVVVSETSPETIEAPVVSPSLDKASVKSEKEVKKNGKGLKSNSVRDWWWKHDNEAAAASASPVCESKKVKDYVMEWIGKDVNKEKPKSEWEGGGRMRGKVEKKRQKSRKRRLEWWESMEEDKEGRKPGREWWKEEHSEELARKKKKKRKQQHKRKGVNSDDDSVGDDNVGDEWWMSDDALYGEGKESRRRSRNNRGGGVDWWLDGLSGELWRARRNSYDSAVSGEIPKSGGVSSTPSMRGTVCYVAPEYGYGGDVSEKCDVYSFGILLLVIISGRRPLQVTGSPMSEFQRANLLSWARHCAKNGKLIELVDQSILSLDKEQALLCIKVALLCLLKLPARRPSMKEVVGMLSGELEPPQLPVEYSPSTPSRFPFKSRKKGQ